MDDLVTWLRAQLDDDERAARAWLPLGNPTAADREHIARHEPGRALAEVDADRRILDLYEQTDFGDFTRRTALEDVIRLRALPKADLPGYRDEWKP